MFRPRSFLVSSLKIEKCLDFRQVFQPENEKHGLRYQRGSIQKSDHSNPVLIF